MLDTGADETLIPRHVADRLGIVVDERSTYLIESAGGEVAVNYGTAAIELTDGIERFEWPLTIGVTNQEWSEAILGHSGVLEFFDVMFRGAEHVIVLERNGTDLPLTN